MQLQSKLGEKLLRTVMLFYFVVAMSLTGVQLYSEVEEEKQQLGQEIIYVLRSFQPAFEQALWTIDDEQVMSILQGILTNKDIQRLEVKGPKGEDYLSLNGETENKEYDYSFKIDLIHEQDGNSTNIGEVLAYTSNNVVLKGQYNLSFLLCLMR